MIPLTIPWYIRFLLMFVTGYTYKHTECGVAEVTEFHMKELFGITYVISERTYTPPGQLSPERFEKRWADKTDDEVRNDVEILLKARRE